MVSNEVVLLVSLYDHARALPLPVFSLTHPYPIRIPLCTDGANGVIRLHSVDMGGGSWRTVPIFETALR